MNPEHADRERLDTLRAGGINRLSLGVQSLNPAVLRKLGRVHSPTTAHEAADNACEFGFDLSIDLIFAVPGQDQQAWQSDVRRVVELEPDHISIYGLTYESGTPFTSWLGTGRLVALDEDWEAEAYSWAAEYLDSQGYQRYEVSNFARDNRASLHNQAYWDGSSYLGLGPSAHSLLGNIRTANMFDLWNWTAALMDEKRIPWESSEELDDRALAREKVLLGLRTARGLDLNALPAQYMEEVSERAGEIVREGFARRNEGGSLVLSSRGMLVADMLAARLSP
jgi:oxygen-independent coproporphyrinogen-3 oxidase